MANRLVNTALGAFLALLSGCTPDAISELRSDSRILQAFLEAGSPEQKVFLYSLDPGTGQPLPIQGAVEIRMGDETWELQRSGAHYETVAGARPLPYQTEGLLRAISGGREVLARFRTPGPVSPQLISALSFSVDPLDPAANAFAVSWTPVPGYEYVARLDALNTAAGAIPFEQGGGEFAQRFSGPFPNPSIVLRNTDFAFYGAHELRIVAIPPEYRDLYFFNPEGPGGLIREAPSNVTGGEGFVAAVSSFRLNLSVNP